MVVDRGRVAVDVSAGAAAERSLNESDDGGRSRTSGQVVGLAEITDRQIRLKRYYPRAD